MLLTIVLNLLPFGPTFETPINTEAALDKGIIFNKEGKILITEKFINVEFLVPFPRYNFTIRQQVETLLNELSKKWITQSEFCNLTDSTTYRNQTDAFNNDWLYTKIYSFRINVINAIPTLLDKRLPISLVPRKSLIKILDSVHDSQKNAPDRLTLAIPMTDILSYYDAKLVQEISTVEDGLLLTLAIPLASSQTVFEVYRAIVIPMPQKDSVDALRYVIEGEYLAISEGQMETTVLTKAQYDNCLGSPRYRICHETMETHLGFSSCLATLKFHHTISALKVCDTEKVVLPNPERAQNLGYGIWLLTSASSDYTLSEIGMDENGRHINVPHKGCNICLITLKCGHTMFSDNIKIRADLQSCQYLPATRIKPKLPDPLAHLIDSVPNIHELPKYDSPTEANLDLLKKVKTEFIYSNRKLSTESLDAIAKPITTEMQTFKPALIDKLESYVPIELSLSLSIIVFIGNLALHILFMFLYHKVAFVRRMVPNFMKLNGTNVPLNAVVSVPKHLKADVVTTLAKQLKQPPTVISPEELGTLKRQRRNSMPATSTISLNTMDRFNTDDELDHQAQPREESML